MAAGCSCSSSLETSWAIASNPKRFCAPERVNPRPEDRHTQHGNPRQYRREIRQLRVSRQRHAKEEALDLSQVIARATGEVRMVNRRSAIGQPLASFDQSMSRQRLLLFG